MAVGGGCGGGVVGEGAGVSVGRVNVGAGAAVSVGGAGVSVGGTDVGVSVGQLDVGVGAGVSVDGPGVTAGVGVGHPVWPAAIGDRATITSEASVTRMARIRKRIANLPPRTYAAGARLRYTIPHFGMFGNHAAPSI